MRPALTQNGVTRWREWICDGVDGLEIEIPIRVNYQYSLESEDIVNFQVFHKRDEREEYDLSEYMTADQVEYIRCAIFDAIKLGDHTQLIHCFSL